MRRKKWTIQISGTKQTFNVHYFRRFHKHVLVHRKQDSFSRVKLSKARGVIAKWCNLELLGKRCMLLNRCSRKIIMDVADVKIFFKLSRVLEIWWWLYQLFFQPKIFWKLFFRKATPYSLSSTCDLTEFFFLPLLYNLLSQFQACKVLQSTAKYNPRHSADAHF